MNQKYSWQDRWTSKLFVSDSDIPSLPISNFSAVFNSRPSVDGKHDSDPQPPQRAETQQQRIQEQQELQQQIQQQQQLQQQDQNSPQQQHVLHNNQKQHQPDVQIKNAKASVSKSSDEKRTSIESLHLIDSISKQVFFRCDSISRFGV